MRGARSAPRARARRPLYSGPPSGTNRRHTTRCTGCGRADDRDHRACAGAHPPAAADRRSVTAAPSVPLLIPGLLAMLWVLVAPRMLLIATVPLVAPASGTPRRGRRWRMDRSRRRWLHSIGRLVHGRRNDDLDGRRWALRRSGGREGCSRRSGGRRRGGDAGGARRAGKRMRRAAGQLPEAQSVQHEADEAHSRENHREPLCKRRLPPIPGTHTISLEEPLGRPPVRSVAAPNSPRTPRARALHDGDA